jgi:hypothetical protein
MTGDLKTKLMTVESSRDGFGPADQHVTNWCRNPEGPAAVAEIERLEAMLGHYCKSCGTVSTSGNCDCTFSGDPESRRAVPLAGEVARLTLEIERLEGRVAELEGPPMEAQILAAAHALSNSKA